MRRPPLRCAALAAFLGVSEEEAAAAPLVWEAQPDDEAEAAAEAEAPSPHGAVDEEADAAEAEAVAYAAAATAKEANQPELLTSAEAAESAAAAYEPFVGPEADEAEPCGAGAPSQPTEY